MKKLLPVIIIIFFTAIFSGNPAQSLSNEKNKVELGKQIYEENCKVCHGDKGNGKTFVANVLNPPPKNFTNPMVANNLSREQMIISITKGRPGTGMMPWGANLTQKEIGTVADYIRKTFMLK